MGEGGVRALDTAQGFADDLLSKASAFAALGSYSGGITHLTIAAASFVDGFTDLAIGHTLAKTHVHMNYPLGLR